MKTISITVDEDTLTRLDKLAEDRTGAVFSRSSLIREAMRDYVVRVERLIEEERERAIFRQRRTELAREATALVREQAKP